MRLTTPGLTINIGLLGMMFSHGFAQGTQAPCPQGNQIVSCDGDQVAVCRTIGDSIAHQCLTPPEELTGLSVDLWLLSFILDDTLTVTDQSIEKYRAIVRAGRWGSGKDSVFFSVPRNWQGTLQEKRN